MQSSRVKKVGKFRKRLTDFSWYKVKFYRQKGKNHVTTKLVKNATSFSFNIFL